MISAIALSAARKGEKLTVRLPDGTTIRVTAESDILSPEVLIIGDRALSKEQQQVTQERTVQFFGSKNSYEDDANSPWAYLFEINDYQALLGKEGQSVNYTDTSWSLDDLEGHYKGLGDGGGRFKTLPELLDEYASQYYPYPVAITEAGSGLSLLKAGKVQYQGISPVGSVPPFADSDGVNFYTFGTAFRANEKNRQVQFISRRIHSDREYWVRERALSTLYKFVWQDRDPFLQIGEFYAATITGDSAGVVDYREATYTVKSTVNSFNTFARYRINNDGSILETYRLNGNFSPATAWVEERRAEFLEILNTIDSDGFSSPIFNNIPLDLDGRIFTGQQILNGELTIPYTINGSVPFSFDAVNRTFNINIKATTGETTYTSSVYLIPVVKDRSPGVKSIYIQVGQNKKTLLHEIPSFEVWDGYVSPVGNNTIEVVLRCGKKHNPNLVNAQSNTKLDFGKFIQREWAQTRVYQIDSFGRIISEQIFNNSGTDLNPGSISDTIIVNSDNWQRSWLSNYDDWRTLTFSYLPNPRNFIEFFKRMGVVDSLESGCRTYYSELLSSIIKAIEATTVARYTLVTTGYGTLTSKGFVYLNPLLLFDKNIEMDYSYSFGTNFFPSRNYSVFSGLTNNSVTKSVYYLAQPTYESGTFDIGISLEKPTTFPAIDLKDEYAAGLKLPTEITRSDWNTEWSEDPEINTDLLRFAIKAIAFLE